MSGDKRMKQGYTYVQTNIPTDREVGYGFLCGALSLGAGLVVGALAIAPFGLFAAGIVGISGSLIMDKLGYFKPGYQRIKVKTEESVNHDLEQTLQELVPSSGFQKREITGDETLDNYVSGMLHQMYRLEIGQHVDGRKGVKRWYTNTQFEKVLTGLQDLIEGSYIDERIRIKARQVYRSLSAIWDFMGSKGITNTDSRNTVRMVYDAQDLQGSLADQLSRNYTTIAFVASHVGRHGAGIQTKNSNELYDLVKMLLPDYQSISPNDSDQVMIPVGVDPKDPNLDPDQAAYESNVEGTMSAKGLQVRNKEVTPDNELVVDDALAKHL